MKALILVGGLGTRLRPYTLAIPKPLLPLSGKPILQGIIERFRDSNISEIILATGYRAELIRGFCGDGSRFGVEISYVHESKPLGTAGPLSLVRGMIEPDERFILMNGDIVTQLAFDRFIDCGVARNCDLTVGYAKSAYRSPFGVLRVHDGMIQDIHEKPEYLFAVSAGIYLVKGSALALVPDGIRFSMPELIKKMMERGIGVGAYLIDEFWMGLESFKDFKQALKELNKALPSFQGSSWQTISSRTVDENADSPNSPGHRTVDPFERQRSEGIHRSS